MFSAFSSSAVTITPATGFTLVPGMQLTFTVPSNGLVYISTYGGIATTSASSTGYSNADVVLAIDGVIPANGGWERVIASNTSTLVNQNHYWSFGTFQSVTPGTHTIGIYTEGTGIGSNTLVGGDGTSVNQGELTVIIITQ
jgi:hypothetical protein